MAMVKYLFWSLQMWLEVSKLPVEYMIDIYDWLITVPRSPQRNSVVSHLQLLERLGPLSNLSSGFTLWNVKMQIHTVFPGWTASTLPQPSPPTPDIDIQHKHAIWMCLQFNIMHSQYKMKVSVVYRNDKCHVIEVEIFHWFGQQTHGGIPQYKLIITIRGILDLNQHWDRGVSE